MAKPPRTRALLISALALLAAPALAWLGCQLARERDLRSAARRGAEREGLLSGALAVSAGRMRFKEALVAELLAAQLGLREAAARLASYHAAEPRVEGAKSGQELMARFPGTTEQERCARNLAMWARADAVISRSEAAERFACRLERELAEAYGEPPAKGLPGPP
jgi:hypothetical protein